MPANVLKLDRSFVIDIANDDDADVIAASIIHMARTLRKKVVVEGVESEEQLTLLARHGAHSIQGFLVSRPLPPEDFERFVRNYVPALHARGSIDSVSSSRSNSGANASMMRCGRSHSSVSAMMPNCTPPS